MNVLEIPASRRPGAPRALALGVGLVLAGGAAAQNALTLPIPEKDTLPREKISLTIKLPEKIEQSPVEPPPVRPKLRSSVFDHYDFGLRREIPRRRFVYATLDRMHELGVKPDLASSRLRHFRMQEFTVMGRAIWAYYLKLLDIYRKDALPHFEITPLDIERFRQVMDIFSPMFESEFRPYEEADRHLTQMIDLLKKIKGQGTIKLVELKEADDGSMVLEVEVRKEPRLTRHGMTPARLRARRPRPY